MSLKHPVERGLTEQRGPFDQFAQRASHFASSGLFFGFCALLVLAWVGGYVFGASAGYEQAIGTALTALTLLLLALLQNAELRAEHAIQTKLDALATGMLEIVRETDSNAGGLLERAIGREEHV